MLGIVLYREEMKPLLDVRRQQTFDLHVRRCPMRHVRIEVFKQAKFCLGILRDYLHDLVVNPALEWAEGGISDWGPAGQFPAHVFVVRTTPEQHQRGMTSATIGRKFALVPARSRLVVGFRLAGRRRTAERKVDDGCRASHRGEARFKQRRPTQQL